MPSARSIRRLLLAIHLLPIILLSGCASAVALRPAVVADWGAVRVRPGIEVLLQDSLACVKGKVLGLVTNQTGIDSRGRSTISLLAAHPDLKLTRLFSPEHGLDGSRPAGEQVKDAVDPASGLPVTSLYQGSRAVDPLLLKGLDLLLFDVQDIGLRPYTFASTLAEVMKAARAADIEVVVLDRPNPLGGKLVSGLTLEPAWSSFIGLYPEPYLHGLTIGELARLFNEAFGIGCRLRVIPLEGWKRDMTFDKTGLPWIPSSPNVPTWDTPLAMSITGPVGELGSASIGIGTASPFWVAGAPKLDAARLVKDLTDNHLPGITFIPWNWTPATGKWAGKSCQGVRLLILDQRVVNPGRAQLALLRALAGQLDSLTTGASAAQLTMFNRAMGTDQVLTALTSGKGWDELIARLGRDEREFRLLRKKSLIYPD